MSKGHHRASSTSSVNKKQFTDRWNPSKRTERNNSRGSSRPWRGTRTDSAPYYSKAERETGNHLKRSSRTKSVNNSRNHSTEGVAHDSRTVQKRKRVWRTSVRSDTTTTDEDTEDDRVLGRKNLVNGGMGNVVDSVVNVEQTRERTSFKDILIQGNSAQEEEDDEDDEPLVEWDRTENPLPANVGWGDWVEDFAEEEEEEHRRREERSRRRELKRKQREEERRRGTRVNLDENPSETENQLTEDVGNMEAEGSESGDWESPPPSAPVVDVEMKEEARCDSGANVGSVEPKEEDTIERHECVEPNTQETLESLVVDYGALSETIEERKEENQIIPEPQNRTVTKVLPVAEAIDRAVAPSGLVSASVATPTIVEAVQTRDSTPVEHGEGVAAEQKVKKSKERFEKERAQMMETGRYDDFGKAIVAVLVLAFFYLLFARKTVFLEEAKEEEDGLLDLSHTMAIFT